MACRDAYNFSHVDKLLFGVDSKVQSNRILQNNLTEFEWATRNKLYPNFWARNIVGENCLTKDEIDFLHGMGCKIIAIYEDADMKESEEQGRLHAKKIEAIALQLKITKGCAIFMELKKEDNATTDYMSGFAKELIAAGYTPGFRADTDANFSFDREYSRGMQIDKELFGKCLVWAVSPSLMEYERITTSHFIHPDNWTPYTPSGLSRDDIAIWQYGKECHPICDNNGIETTFNINLVRKPKIIIEKMF